MSDTLPVASQAQMMAVLMVLNQTRLDIAAMVAGGKMPQAIWEIGDTKLMVRAANMAAKFLTHHTEIIGTGLDGEWFIPSRTSATDEYACDGFECTCPASPVGVMPDGTIPPKCWHQWYVRTLNEVVKRFQDDPPAQLVALAESVERASGKDHQQRADLLRGDGADEEGFDL